MLKLGFKEDVEKVRSNFLRLLDSASSEAEAIVRHPDLYVFSDHSPVAKNCCSGVPEEQLPHSGSRGKSEEQDGSECEPFVH